jgi:hypothetical protein
MTLADRRLFIGGLISLILGLPVFLIKWYVFIFGYPFVAAGLSLMILSGARSLLARHGVGRDRATIITGVAMILQFIPAYVFANTLGIYELFLSFGVAFCGAVTCMAVIVPILRDLREMADRSAKGPNPEIQKGPPSKNKH